MASYVVLCEAENCDICKENPVTYTGVMTLQGEIALCESCHND
jgi:hypothetical protein